MSITLFLLLLAFLLSGAGCSAEDRAAPGRRLKILVSNPSFCWSHMRFQGRLADLLTEAGHEVHVLIPDANSQMGNYTGVTRGQRIIRVTRPLDKQEDLMRAVPFMTDQFSGPKSMLWDGSMYNLHRLAAEHCEEMLRDRELIATLEAEHYDVGIAEIFNVCAFGVFKRLGVRTSLGTIAIGMSAHVAHNAGIPTFPSWSTSKHTMSVRHSEERSFLDRVIAFWTEVLDQWVLLPDMVAVHQRVFTSAFGPQFPAIDEVLRNISLIFVNSQELFELPHLTSKKVIYVGGLLEKKNKEAGHLSAREEEILGNASSGVVLFSFGTIANPARMSRRLKAAFVRAFAQFPTYDFIWKYPSGHSVSNESEAELFVEAPNVHRLEWVQQKTVLQHPRTRAFITHCGLNSLNEAAAAGVPIVAVPLFGDQLYNTVLIRKTRIGVQLDLLELAGDSPPGGEQAIVEALRDVLHNPAYASNARLLSHKLATQPFSSAEKFLKWVEFAAEYNELNELNLPYYELSAFVYYSLDVIAVSMVLVLATGWLATVLTRLVVREIFVQRWATRSKRNEKMKAA